jgi:SAM-dependent methyltransferase/uncharacterized coiled-coil protein SlyX
MPENRQTIVERIAGASRRLRELLAPEMLKKFDIEIEKLSKCVDEMSKNLNAGLAALRSEIQNRLGEFAAVHARSEALIRQLDESNKCEEAFRSEIIGLLARLNDDLDPRLQSVERVHEELRSVLLGLMAALDSQSRNQEAFKSESRNLLSHLDTSLNSRMNNLETFQSELRNMLGDLNTSLNSRLNSVENFQSESRNGLSELNTSLNSRMNSLETFQFETRNILSELNTGLNSRMGGVETFQIEARNVVSELNTGLNSRMNSMETFLSETKNLLDALGGSLNSRLNNLENFQAESRNLVSALNTSLNSRLNSLETVQSEAKNLIGHVNTNLDGRMNSLETYQSESRNLIAHMSTSLESRLNLFESKKLPPISDQIQELMASQFDLFNEVRRGRQRPTVHAEEKYKPASGQKWHASLERAKGDFRTVYPFWKERLDTMLQAFRKTKIGNAAWAGDVKSRIFRGFVERYAEGRVLDVGCGVFGRPYYLSSYPAELISGIDPLKPEESPDFEFVRGISEYLPWPNSSFSTVISATSLDHCLSLEHSLAEMRRVLRSKGRLLLWIDSIPGAPKYEPADPKFTPSDQFHLFHFDATWFEPMVTKAYEIVDRAELQRADYVSIMYCLERTSGSVASERR